MRQNKQQIQDLKVAISKTIQKYLDQEQKQVFHKNSNKNKSTQLKRKKQLPEQQLNCLKIQSLYDELVYVLQKLRRIMKRMNTTNKIKKQKLNIFNAKLIQFIKELQTLIQTKGINLKIDRYVAALVEDTNKALTQGDRILTTLEKESGPFYCSRTDATKYKFYDSIINIIGYKHVWSVVPRFSPVIQQKIQKVEVLTPIKYDLNSLQRLIEQQIQKYWPQQQSVEKYVQCERAHVDSQVIESRQSAVSSLSSQSQPKVLSQHLPNNYIKIQEVVKLKQDLEHEALLRQAHQKLFGFGRPQRVNQALEAYKKMLTKNTDKLSLALNALGQVYEEGKYAQTDRQKSEEYYRRSAGLNDEQGLYKMAKYLQKGLIKSPDKQSNTNTKRQAQLRSAIEYYQKAAQKGHLDAITDLGYIYEKGIQNTTLNLNMSNVSTSQHESSRVSDQTDTNSQFFVQPNFNYALKYYQIARKAQFPRAINNLGALLIRQHKLIQQRVRGTNLQKGIKYLKKAAQMGYIKSYFNIGRCYHNGIGVQVDYQSARGYYQKGSQKGDISCKVEYIRCFLTDGLPKSGQTEESQLANLLQLVREVLITQPNNMECLFYMGLFHEKGNGVIRNPQLAYNYVSRSANYNFLPAVTKLADYIYSGFHVKKDLEQAVTLYQKAVAGGQPQAMINLSLILQKGLIRPVKGKSSEYIKHLQKQALRTNSSNAFLIAGLRDNNYHIEPNWNINPKIMKSIQLGNRDAINLVEKTTRDNHTDRESKVETNQLKQRTGKVMRQGTKADMTVKQEKHLKTIRSTDNLKTTRI